MRPRKTPPDQIEPFEALLEGDTAPLSAYLDRLNSLSIKRFQRVWWEISTLYGRVVGQLDVQWGERLLSYSLAFAPPGMTGGPPREVVNPEALVRDWREALAQPPSRELHRRNMAETLAALRARSHPQPDSADALLRHHTDLPVDYLAGRKPVDSVHGISEVEAVYDLLPLAQELASPEAFEALVRAGLDSPSLPRRDLCWRLLRLPA